MGALALITALAAQATAPAGAAPTPSTMPSADTNLGASTYLDLEAGAGYSTNPLMRFGDHTESAFARISAHAVHTRVTERTTTILSAFGQGVFYTDDQGAHGSADVSARHDARVSEKLRLFGDLDFAYDQGGQLDTRIITVPDVPLPPGTVQPPVLLPQTGDLLSITDRHYRASGHIGAQFALSAREYLNVSSGLEYEAFKSSGFDSHFTTIPVSLGYDRQISARTTLGARLSARHTEYSGPGSFTVFTPQATFQTMLTDRLSLNGAVGVSLASVDNGLFTRHTTGIAANASLCWRGEHDSLCARGGVDQEAATTAGPARNYNVGVDYGRQLDANQTIHLSVGANHYSTPVEILTDRSFRQGTYFVAAADYSRRFSDRFFGGINGSARKLAQTGTDPKADISGSLFIRYRLGDIR